MSAPWVVVLVIGTELIACLACLGAFYLTSYFDERYREHDYWRHQARDEADTLIKPPIQ